MKEKKILILLLAFAVIGSNILQKIDYTPDDTFIYLQYAKNIASGNGFSFNPGEQSYGVTSPLWVLVITLPFFIGLDALWFSKIIDILIVLAAIFLFFRLASHFFSNKILVYSAVGIFILNAWFIRWSFTGMETNLAVMLIIWIFLLFYTQKYLPMFFLSGLFYLTRPEGFLLFFILLVCVFFSEKNSSKLKLVSIMQMLFATGVPVIIFLLYAKLSFGTFIPNTALGKSTFNFNGFVILAQIKEIMITLGGASIIEIALTGLFFIIAFKKKDFQGTVPMLLWIVSLCFLYIVSDTDIISRYLLIISPFLIITAFKFIEYTGKHQTKTSLAIFLTVLVFSQFIFYKYVKPSTDDFSRGINECFVPIGNWLKDNTPVSSRILVNDVGAIGFISNRKIIDAAALINADLELNRRIMATPIENRLETHKLLNFINADYVIDRDSTDIFVPIEFEEYRLIPQFMKKFPSLGISDSSPRYFKIYKVSNKE